MESTVIVLLSIWSVWHSTRIYISYLSMQTCCCQRCVHLWNNCTEG